LHSPAMSGGGGGGNGSGCGGGRVGAMSFSWTRYLHKLVADKSHKVLLMGGLDADDGRFEVTNRVEMMVIDGNGTKISWQACAPMIKKRYSHSAYYCQGQVFSVSSNELYGANGIETSEHYDCCSQTAVEVETNLPKNNGKYYHIAMTQLDDSKIFAVGAFHQAPLFGWGNRAALFNRVFCLDNKRHSRVQDGTWIEQEARPITARNYAAVATYKGKVWLAGGVDGDGLPLSSVEVYDPLVGSWQAAGDLTKKKHGKLALFAIKDDLYVAIYQISPYSMRVEKRDEQTGTWQLVSELNAKGDHSACAFAACGSIIYFLGGHPNLKTEKSWNSFDTRTNMWASQQEQYQDEATRQLPRSFTYGRAVCITPSKQLLGLGTWTSYPNFVNREVDVEA